MYGTSAPAYLLAADVPTQEALDDVDGDIRRLRPVLRASPRRIATEAGLNS
ncbi:hypothetical protein ACH4JS_13025 [Streptomyces sp. NPDC017638]|uniref:hypothetical protein n=1 Tax=Streptomyces sp. NPDC017638 TaxID=3365004 RepID=UPI0037A18B83